MFAICSAEGTLHLGPTNGGRGLLEHYGTWSLVFSCPLILVILRNILSKTENSFTQVRQSAVSEKAAQEVDKIHERLKDILRCRKTEHRICFYLLITIGVFSWVVNLQNTRHATIIFGHEVWDSSTYLGSFILGKIFVAFLYIFIFPVTTYIVAVVWFSILALSSKISIPDAIRVSPYHPDKCGGLRHLGKTTLAISQLSLPFALVIIGHYYTHKNFYETLVLACAIVALGTMAILYLPFVELHKRLKTVKNGLLESLYCLIDTETVQFLGNRKLAAQDATHIGQLSILAGTTLYSQTEKLNTWPYRAADRLKWISMLISPLIGFLLKKVFG